MHTCGSFFYNYGVPHGGPSGRRSSAKNVQLSDKHIFLLKSKNDLWLKCLKTTSFRLPELQSSTGKMNDKKAMRKFE